MWLASLLLFSFILSPIFPTYASPRARRPPPDPPKETWVQNMLWTMVFKKGLVFLCLIQPDGLGNVELIQGYNRVLLSTDKLNSQRVRYTPIINDHLSNTVLGYWNWNRTLAFAIQTSHGIIEGHVPEYRDMHADTDWGTKLSALDTAKFKSIFLDPYLSEQGYITQALNALRKENDTVPVKVFGFQSWAQLSQSSQISDPEPRPYVSAQAVTQIRKEIYKFLKKNCEIDPAVKVNLLFPYPWHRSKKPKLLSYDNTQRTWATAFSLSKDKKRARIDVLIGTEAEKQPNKPSVSILLVLDENTNTWIRTEKPKKPEDPEQPVQPENNPTSELRQAK